MKVKSQTGDSVDFDPEKLRRSLLSSGASMSVVDDILQRLTEEVYEGITTRNIYKKAYSLLKKNANFHAARYNLKTAIHLLGPTGFYFEQYIAKIFESEKYEVKMNVTLQGRCVSHEVDVLVKKNDRIAMIECKFHVSQEAASDVKVPMYILSRYNDLNQVNHKVFSQKDEISECWIATNNRFTTDAIDFAACSGIKLLSWDYPKDNSIKVKNYRDCLYPVTCLTTITLAEKEKLLALGVILARDLTTSPERLAQIKISPKRVKNIVKEVTELCKCF
ncbi:restriction endonuclease [Flavobacterium faecale]|uniref:restriction endonuclease n=1 Tax=Flavobacterium faecale TaxID=1355330 RepID=UPI003AAD596F